MGKKIIHWCNSDDTAARNEDVRTRIMKCDSLSVLDELYAENPELRDLFREEFASKQEDLLFINQEKFRQNGHYQH